MKLNVYNIKSDYVLIESLINTSIKYYILEYSNVRNGRLNFNTFSCYEKDEYTGEYDFIKRRYSSEGIVLDGMILLYEGTFDECKIELDKIINLMRDIDKYDL